MTPSEIVKLLEDYSTALEEERAAMVAQRAAKAAADFEAIRVVLDGYRTETIDGKNERIRGLQEAELIDASNGVHWLDVEQNKADEAVSIARNDRTAIEAEIGLTKAWLYSQGSRL